jgi:DNA-binding transcriptional LysR family regulator
MLVYLLTNSYFCIDRQLESAAMPSSQNAERFDLKRLRYFIAVARAGSFRGAAERLGVAQPHLSRQIMALEANLRHRLFVRRARHVELTDAGRTLLQASYQLFAELDRIPQRLDEASSGLLGSLSIGLMECGSFNSLPAKIIESVMHAAPHLALTFCREPRTQLIEAILERRIQAAFVRPPAVVPPNIRVDHLLTERMLLAHNMPDVVPDRSEIGYAELAEMTTMPFVLWQRENAPEIYDGLIEACLTCGYSPHVLFHMPRSIHALFLASRGVGFAPVPESMETMKVEGLHFMPFAPDVLSARLALITRADEQAESVKILRREAIACANAAVERSEAASAVVGRLWMPGSPGPFNAETVPLLN